MTDELFENRWVLKTCKTSFFSDRLKTTGHSPHVSCYAPTMDRSYFHHPSPQQWPDSQSFGQQKTSSTQSSTSQYAGAQQMLHNSAQKLPAQALPSRHQADLPSMLQNPYAGTNMTPVMARTSSHTITTTTTTFTNAARANDLQSAGAQQQQQLLQPAMSSQYGTVAGVQTVRSLAPQPLSPTGASLGQRSDTLRSTITIPVPVQAPVPKKGTSNLLKSLFTKSSSSKSASTSPQSNFNALERLKAQRPVSQPTSRTAAAQVFDRPQSLWRSHLHPSHFQHHHLRRLPKRVPLIS